jgi:hypothetical protein
MTEALTFAGGVLAIAALLASCIGFHLWANRDMDRLERQKAEDDALWNEWLEESRRNIEQNVRNGQ